MSVWSMQNLSIHMSGCGWRDGCGERECDGRRMSGFGHAPIACAPPSMPLSMALSMALRMRARGRRRAKKKTTRTPSSRPRWRSQSSGACPAIAPCAIPRESRRARPSSRRPRSKTSGPPRPPCPPSTSPTAPELWAASRGWITPAEARAAGSENLGREAHRPSNPRADQSDVP